ncbi:helix-turn-helix domain-containing protein [Formosa algae]|uniref:AraC-like DNA-binding protein n=1 Tax=Formosa algae TaxID=225843 RepID=A0A9X1C917_9FLAO|nr:helix-turn-helix domain-containing protein [Formosa algae]MBP1839448.1 AraC-like DNA-binding protein [Formosa algae]MDQ0334752.1 AraC-like DNA-binding protein [Formosa algae]OEI82002.1 AraC family transcriptional regulator [Formosa algae]PNW27462.1 AraC family transcriptional regulator [Formosa algae]
MKLFVKFDYQVVCKRVLEAQLNALEIPYTLNGIGEIELASNLKQDKKEALISGLEFYGIEIIQDEKDVLVQRIKDIVSDIIYNSTEDKAYNTSTLLAEKLNYSYSYLSGVFSEVTYSSIENFVILKKIDYAKELMSGNKSLTLTEIAHRLQYSSVAHLSGQFKKITGLTPSSFQKIIEKRRSRL